MNNFAHKQNYSGRAYLTNCDQNEQNIKTRDR